MTTIFLSTRECEFILAFAKETENQYVQIDWEQGNIWHSVKISDPPRNKKVVKVPLFEGDI